MSVMTAAGGTWVGAPVHLTRRGYGAAMVAAVLVTLALGMVVLHGLASGAQGEVRPAPGAPTVRVVVQAGDSLWAIAESVRPEDDPRGVVAEIQAANGLGGNVIQPGQVLAVPVAG